MSDNQPPQEPNRWSQPQPPGPPMPPGPGNAPWGAPPPPQKKSGVGKAFGIGCLGVLALFVVIGIISAIAGGGHDTKTTATKPAASSSPTHESAPKKADDSAKPAPSPAKTKADKPAAKPKKTDDTKVVFKVWGTAPAGALGPLDIMYGSDSDNRKGDFHNGKFEATLPLKSDAMYYSLDAQLQGSGDIHCSVTIGDQTKTGHASGGYNICSAQLNSGLFGGWD
jgi:hypothetical protein